MSAENHATAYSVAVLYNNIDKNESYLISFAWIYFLKFIAEKYKNIKIAELEQWKLKYWINLLSILI